MTCISLVDLIDLSVSCICIFLSLSRSPGMLDIDIVLATLATSMKAVPLRELLKSGLGPRLLPVEGLAWLSLALVDKLGSISD